jgi:hypothetical protein
MLACRCLAVVSALVCLIGADDVSAQEMPGAIVYQKKCASCHGKNGEGAKEFPQPLVGKRTLMQLSSYIAKNMPDDAPGTCTGEEAEKVAAYIFDAFYSPAAQARNKTPRLELARLTVSEYRYALADLIGTFGKNGQPAKDAKDEHGLRGEYFNIGPKRKRTLAFTRVDPHVRVDLGDDKEKLNSPELAANWQGSVIAPDTGLYEFIVKTEHSTKLFVNNVKQPLIDASVKSASETEFRGSIHLLAGRAYPLRLEFSLTSLGVLKEKKDKLPPPKATIALEWKPPHGTADLIPQRFLRPTDSATAFAPAVPLPPDDRSAGYERGTAVSKAWVLATTDGAIEAATYLVANLAELTGIRNDAANRPARLKDFCLKFAEKAFRKPLTPEQKKLYVDRQFEVAKDPAAAVMRVALLVLQSPRFLYRELGAAEGETDGYDVASRLSFGLWDTLPDQQLLQAAAASKLKTRADIVREVERMMNDRRAQTKLRAFLLQWLKLDQTSELPKDHKLFPDFSAAVVSDLRTSLELFLEETISDPASDYRQFFLAEHLYLNGRLSKLYGAELPGDADFQKVVLKNGERAGVLTHPYLMANFSYTATSSPIHRGVFLARNILGVSLRPPPDAFTPLPAELHPKLNTRERITLQTSPNNCMTCHGVINPLGFTLERYDAIGRFRETENEKQIDATGTFVTRGGSIEKFNGAKDLAKFVVSSEEAQEAFVARLFHHLVRQPILAYGPDKLTELQRFFADNRYNVRDLAMEITVQSALPDRPKQPSNPGKK